MMKNRAQGAQQQKPGQKGQIDGIFPKWKEHSVIQSYTLASTPSRPPMFKIMVEYISIHVLDYKYTFNLSKTAPK